MKIIIGAIALVVVMGVVIQYRDSLFTSYKYVREEVEVVKEVKPDWAQDEDAVKAAQAVIRKKELEAELASLDTQIKELQSRRKTVTDELTTY
jgi:hypothetical protein